MKKIFFVLIVSMFFLFSCATMPESEPETKKDNFPKKELATTEAPAEVVEKEVEIEKKAEHKVEKKKTPKKPEKKHDDEVVAKFNDVVITKKDKEKAKSEIEVIVNKLNKITYKKNYSQWRAFLSAPYIEHFSNPAVLKDVSDKLPGIARGMKLNGLKDYFIYVFVASRGLCKVDDITYLSPVKVQVIKMERGKPILFYNLQKINNKWLLVP